MREGEQGVADLGYGGERAWTTRRDVSGLVLCIMGNQYTQRVCSIPIPTQLLSRLYMRHRAGSSSERTNALKRQRGEPRTWLARRSGGPE